MIERPGERQLREYVWFAVKCGLMRPADAMRVLQQASELGGQVAREDQALEALHEKWSQSQVEER